MTYSDTQLAQIEEMAGLFMRLPDIAALVGVTTKELKLEVSNEKSAVGNAYRKGKAEAILRIRRNEKELADAGSTVALDNLHRALAEMLEDE